MIQVFALLLTMCLSWNLLGGQAMAAQEYTYQITLYVGGQGTFSGTDMVTVDNKKTGSSYTITGDEETILIKGLEIGDVVTMDVAANGAVKLHNNSKYYVKGVRRGGRDNNTVESPAFTVKGDADYVVAYGIQGDQTAYFVHYVDRNGHQVAPSRTYYGNVGDKPVVAFLYVDGYQPQAYNLTKTLSANEAENVFTFVYSPITTGSGSGTGGGGGAVQAPTAGTDETDESSESASQSGENETTESGEDETLPDETIDETQPESEPESQPESDPDDVIDLDDPRVPLVDDPTKIDGEALKYYGAAAIAVFSLIALVLLLWWLLAGRKKDKDEKDASQ